MSLPFWGLLGTEALSSRRRVRGLGLDSSIRHFNDKAVPGLGGLYFGKQLLWALLGIQVAKCCEEGGGVSNIEVANAIEAMSCLQVLRRGVTMPYRVLGKNKMRDKIDDPRRVSFVEASRASFYVTQPMRTGTV